MSPVRSAVVTGAAGGIGRAIALRLAADGLAVSVLDLPAARAGLDALVAELPGEGLAVECDVTDAGSVDAAVAAHVDLVLHAYAEAETFMLRGAKTA